MKTIYIVSGIPRSGTSMMMKMLKEGGLEVFHTTPDEGNEFNPDGYFETSYLRKIHIYDGWLENAYGKGLKVFAPKLEELPKNNFGPVNYKIIFMERDPVASAKSYARMRGTTAPPDQEIIEKYAATRENVTNLIDKRNNMEILYVNYTDMLENSEPKCQEVKDFLGVNLDINKMVAVPNPERRHF